MRRNIIFVFVIALILALFFNTSSSQLSHNISLYRQDFDTIIEASSVAVNKIEPTINENSGLIYFRNLFWTFNDSGGENAFFSFDSTRTDIVQKFIVAGASNVDWEDITQDNDFIYIGDFGNNFGNRKNLVIYKIPKKYISKNNNGLVVAKEIRFKYEDQYDFSPITKKTEYDCEAFLSFNDNLYLFTKDWIYRRTKVYKLPKEEGDYTAKFIASYDVDGLITAAEMSPDLKKVALMGYKDYTPFMIVLSNFKNDEFFDGIKKRYDFFSIHNAQTEGITFTSNNTIYFSCESSGYEAQLFRFNLKY